ncbi:MAG: MFS transporter [Acidimicrobiales bacterium]
MSHFPPGLGRRFWRLWAATGVSSLGDGVVLVAFPLLALAFTHDPLLIAGVVVAGRLPALLVALPAGALADRVNRRRLMMGIEAARFAALAAFGALVVAGADGLWAIYATVFVLGTFDYAFVFAAAAALPTIVAPDQLLRANANLIGVEVTTEELAGQALGGFALAASIALPFVADAGSFVASAALLRTAIPDNAPSGRETTLLADVREGMVWFFRSPLLRLLAGLVSSMAFCQALVVGILVLYGTEDLHLSRAGYGVMLGAAAVGNVVGMLAATQLHKRLGSGWSIGLAGLAAAVSYPVLAATRSPVAAAAALALEAVGVMVGNVAARSLRQSMVPQEMQGRAAAAYQMVILGSLPLGAVVGGVLAGHFGIRTTLLVAGCLQFAILAATAPRLVRLVRRTGTGHGASAPLGPDLVVEVGGVLEVVRQEPGEPGLPTHALG